MTVESKRFRISDETTKAALEEAKLHPVIVEVDGVVYEISVKGVVRPRFTARSVRGSLPPLPSQEHISDDGLEDIIKRANEQHARETMETLELT